MMIGILKRSTYQLLPFFRSAKTMIFETFCTTVTIVLNFTAQSRNWTTEVAEEKVEGNGEILVLELME